MKKIHLALLVCLTALLVGFAFAQQNIPGQNSAAPVSVQNEPVPVPPASDKALSYYHSGNVLWFVEIIWGMLIPALFLFTGFSAKIRNWAQRIGKKWFFVVGIYFIIFTAISTLLDLPLSYYTEFVRQHAYDLSNQTFGKWVGDSFKSLVVGCIFGFCIVWIPYVLLKKAPKRWWLYVGLGTVPFMFLIMLVEPIWIEPLFNDFGPMNNKALEAKVLALADRAGIEGSRVFEVNKSVDTKELSAYVTGFLGTKRIVIWDNTIAKMNEGELLFVLGHEMGHYVLGHIWKLIFFFSLLMLVTLFLADRAAKVIIARHKDRFGFDQLSDIASLPLIMILFSVFGFFIINPIGNWMSRAIEHQADQFGLEITKDNHDAATAFVKLQMENLSNPRPAAWYKILRADHPVLGDRIDYANTYKPWEKGEKLEFEEYFKR
jgi:Zn-dependent protease with chaperone function